MSRETPTIARDTGGEREKSGEFGEQKKKHEKRVIMFDDGVG